MKQVIKEFLGMPQVMNEGTPWTTEEVDRLRRLRKSGITTVRMQFYLLRTPSAIRSKIHRLKKAGIKP